MPTITTRLTFWYVGVFAFIIIVVSVVMYTTFSKLRREAIDSDLKGYAESSGIEFEGESVDIAELFDDMRTTTDKRN